MSKKFSVSSAPKQATPAYDAGDPAVKAKGFQMTATSEGVDLHEPDRHYGFSKVSNAKTKSFLHPPDRLIVGRVIFRAKYIGYLMVKEPKGEPVVKAAVEKIKVACDVKKINDKEFVEPEVDLCISIRALTTVERESKNTVVQHSLPLVSFSADVKRGKKEIFTYIAKTSPKAKEYVCYAYEVPKGQGKQITATVSQAFELAFRKFQESKDIQKQFKALKEKLENAPPEEKEKIKKEIAELEKKKIAEEDRLQRARDLIKSEAEARGTSTSSGAKPAPVKTPAPVPAPAPAPAPVPKPQETEVKKEVPAAPETPAEQQPSGAVAAEEDTNGEDEQETEPPEAEVQVAPAPPPVWKRGFDVALNTLEQQIKDLEEAFEWRKEMERKQKSLLGKDASDQYLAGLEDQLSKMPGNK